MHARIHEDMGAGPAVPFATCVIYSFVNSFAALWSTEEPTLLQHSLLHPLSGQPGRMAQVLRFKLVTTDDEVRVAEERRAAQQAAAEAKALAKAQEEATVSIK